MTGSSSAQWRQPRVAEMVADDIRDRILSGAFPDMTLPAQEELLREFGVSRPSLREALQILEAEGIITVRRGSIGGAVIHLPTSENAAYSLSLVLRAKRISAQDLAAAIRLLEPMCAALCAKRPDRATEVVPTLRSLNCAYAEAGDDDLARTHHSRRFHEAIVEFCGNETLSIVASSLETLWSLHEAAWARDAAEDGQYPGEPWLAHVANDHDLIIDCIERGDADGASEASRKHLAEAQVHALGADDDRRLKVLRVSANTSPRSAPAGG